LFNDGFTKRYTVTCNTKHFICIMTVDSLTYTTHKLEPFSNGFIHITTHLHIFWRTNNKRHTHFKMVNNFYWLKTNPDWFIFKNFPNRNTNKKPFYLMIAHTVIHHIRNRYSYVNG